MATRMGLLAASLVALAVGIAAPPAMPVTDDQPAPVRYDGQIVVRAEVRTLRHLRTVMAISPDIWTESVGLGLLDFRLDPADLKHLEKVGISYEILIQDVQQLIEDQQAGGEGDGGWFEAYKTYDDINAYLATLEALNPDRVEIFVAGQSLEGRDIHGIRIGGDADGPIFLIQGTQHAREWISPMTCMFIADHFIRNDGSDQTITRLLDRCQIMIVPIVNADGYIYTQTERLWRKNRRDNGGGSFGVDLNRNWGYEWGHNSGSSGDPNSQTYRGTAPFSEPETVVMRELILANPRIAFHLDIHSYGQLVLAPWGWTETLPPDHELFQELGAQIQDAIRNVHGRTYIHGPAATTLYLASGIGPDWTYGELSIPAFTFELRDTGQSGFLLPADQIIPTGEEIVPTIMLLADWLTRVMEFTFPNGLPDIVDPDSATNLQVSVVPLNGAQIDQSSLMMHWRTDGGAFQSTPLETLGGALYEVDLPAVACGQTIEYYFSGETMQGDQASSPPDAPADVYSAIAINQTVVFTDDFESDQGWTVQDENLTGGAWGRGVPAGGGDRGDPASDYDGSGQCFATDPADGNTDVDGGPTRLMSPTLDLSSIAQPQITYARWFYNDDGDVDRLTVEISNDDGGSWTLIESVADAGSGGWSTVTINVADFVVPTDTVRVRFSVADNPNDSVTEAAVDAFAVFSATCDATNLVDVAVTRGTLVSGDLDELLDSDDARLEVDSQFGFSVIEPYLGEVLIGAETSATSAGLIDLAIESRISQTGGTASVRLRNWSDTQLHLVHSYGVDQNEAVETVDGVDATDRIRSGDGRIEVSIRYVVAATFSVFGFRTSIDQVVVNAR